ncbi:MAG: ADP-ribosylglycohydrolase family protein [Myxococcaceae bacterium]|nr:ADP-ribosylglycohydrolase family protein [Myxococcaceae bacterium]
MPKQLEMLDNAEAEDGASIRETLPEPEPDAEDTRARVLPAADVLPTLTPRQDAFAGVVLGAAIGDAMGHPTEFLDSVEEIRAKYGAEGVSKFELFWERDGKRFAPYTDDTQMAEAVARALIDSRGSDLDPAMKLMAKRFVAWSMEPQGGHRAPGNACLAGCAALRNGVHWSQAGGEQAGGCGSVMRAYPFGLFFANQLQRAESWAVEHSALTHRDPIALAACAAMAVGVALLVRGERVATVTSEMVAAACRYSPPTAAMMAQAIGDARAGVEPDVTLDRLRAWAAHEAIAAAVYILERHPDDPRAAILEGANTPGDSDSIATLAGALVGARTGARGLPPEWVRDVERADELLALALNL